VNFPHRRILFSGKLKLKSIILFRHICDQLLQFLIDKLVLQKHPFSEMKKTEIRRKSPPHSSLLLKAQFSATFTEGVRLI